MCRILPAIDSLDQYLFHLEHYPQVYRPERCPHCGVGSIWCHGHYWRKADREGEDGVYLNPVPIPRFYCRHCRVTCSRIPACIPPQRWYLWATQEAAFVLLLSGSSLRKVARMCRPSRRTIGRWWRCLKGGFHAHAFHLRSRFPDLGGDLSFSSFWSACIRRMSLAEAFAWIERDGEAIP